MASSNGHVGAVRVLLRAKANALLPRVVFSNVGHTPLDAATTAGHKDVARELILQLGAEGCGGKAALFAGCSPRIARLLLDAGVDTQSPVVLCADGSKAWSVTTILAHTNRRIRYKEFQGKYATEEQLQGLEGIRRLILQAEAIHAVSWQWCAGTVSSFGGHAADVTRKRKQSVSTPLGTILPILRLRVAARGTLLGPVFRLVMSANLTQGL